MLPVLDGRHGRYISMLGRLAISMEPVRRCRVTACLVHKNSIISFGFCQMKSHPFQSKYSKNDDAIFLHAETDCIKNALRFGFEELLSSSTLYVARIKFATTDKKSMVYGLAKPCPGCSDAIRAYSIKHVFYTGDINEICELQKEGS